MLLFYLFYIVKWCFIYVCFVAGLSIRKICALAMTQEEDVLAAGTTRQEGVYLSAAGASYLGEDELFRMPAADLSPSLKLLLLCALHAVLYLKVTGPGRHVFNLLYVTIMQSKLIRLAPSIACVRNVARIMCG